YPRSGYRRDLPPFPTRRSSDLDAAARQDEGRLHFQGAGAQSDRPALEHRQEFGLLKRGIHALLIGDERPCANRRLGEIGRTGIRSEEHTSELQSRENLVCRLLL